MRAVCYADIFEYALTKRQLYQFYVGKTKLSLHTFDKYVANLVKAGLLAQHTKTEKGGEQGKYHYYALSDKRGVFHTTFSRHKYSNYKTLKTRKLLNYIKMVPWVRAVLVTGSLAMNNAKADDDIDFMIITAPQRMWLTRLCLTLLLDTLRLRRKPESVHHQGREVTDKMCLNLYMSTDNLLVKKQNLYTAHEIAQARLIYNRNHTYEQFLAANNWIYRFLPHSPRPKTKLPAHTNERRGGPIDQLLTGVDQWAYSLQKKYMHSKVTTELVLPNQAFFHPLDRSQLILQAFDTRLNKYGVT